MDNPEQLAARIKQIHPMQLTYVIDTAYGKAVKVCGKGAKLCTEYFNRERYLEGFTDTKWKTVRHGIGYLIPFYENPMNRIL